MWCVFPGLASQLREGLLLLGGRRGHQLTAVPAPRPSDHQRLPHYPAAQPEPQIRYGPQITWWWLLIRWMLRKWTRHPRLESSRNLTWTHPSVSVSEITIYLSFIYFIKVVRLTRQKCSHRIWDILQHVRLQKAQQKQFIGTEGPFQRNGKGTGTKSSSPDWPCYILDV